MEPGLGALLYGVGECFTGASAHRHVTMGKIGRQMALYIVSIYSKERISVDFPCVHVPLKTWKLVVWGGESLKNIYFTNSSLFSFL